jgi:hypothetical protein
LNTEDLTDDDGNYTGDTVQRYSEPIAIKASVSTASGYTVINGYNMALGYDKTVIYDDPNCTADEYSVFCIDIPLEYDNAGQMKYDYRVKGVSRSFNTVAYYLERIV